MNGNSVNTNTITFTSLDSGFNAALAVDGPGSSDTINWNASGLTLGSGANTGTVSFTAPNISATTPLTTTGGTTPGNVTFARHGNAAHDRLQRHDQARGRWRKPALAQTLLAGSITTSGAGNGVSFNSPVTLTGTESINTSAGNGAITLSNSITGGGNSLTLNSGSGGTMSGTSVSG